MLQYDDKWKYYVTNYLVQVPYLRKLKHIELLTLIYSLKRINYVEGKEIIKKGECSNYIFLLVDGEIEIQFKFEKKKINRSSVFDVLKPGHLGFIYSSIEEQVQPYSLVARTNCNILIAPQSVIQEISKDNKSFKDNFKTIKSLLEKDEFPLFSDFTVARGMNDSSSDDSVDDINSCSVEPDTHRGLVEKDYNKIHPSQSQKPLDRKSVNKLKLKNSKRAKTFEEEPREMRVLFRLAVLRVMKNIQKVKISSNASL